MSCNTQKQIGAVVSTALLSLIVGDAWECTITMKDGSMGGDPLDLSVYTLNAYVMKDFGLTVLFEPTINIVDAVGGQFIISIAESDSESLTPGVYSGDAAGRYVMLVNITDAATLTTTLFKAIIQCSAGLPQS